MCNRYFFIMVKSSKILKGKKLHWSNGQDGDQKIHNSSYQNFIIHWRKEII